MRQGNYHTRIWIAKYMLRTLGPVENPFLTVEAPFDFHGYWLA
jgi:hypothetical protein